MVQLLDTYRTRVLPELQKEFGRSNRLSIPRMEKIVMSMGVGKTIQEKRRIELAQKELAAITGQKPAICAARKSVSNFKVRKGMKTGLKVTLRGKRMYQFLERLISIAIPRIRDFRGLNPKGFDGRGNFSMGLTEQTVFPEVDPDKVEFQQGMNVTLVTTARNDQESRRLLTLLGMPFRQEDTGAAGAN
jgi:large subunit ribosomal protein L5